jgi:hypothetical protein
MTEAPLGKIPSSPVRPIRPPSFLPSVWAKKNDEHFILQTMCGYSNPNVDLDLLMRVLPLTCSEESLGRQILECLASSRSLTLEEVRGMSGDRHFRYEKLITQLMSSLGYKTKRAFYKEMDTCMVTRRSGYIDISPSVHEKLEAWGSKMGDELENVIVPLDCSAVELGAAVRIGFSRCFARRSF